MNYTEAQFAEIRLPVAGREQPLRCVLVQHAGEVWACSADHLCSCGSGTREATCTHLVFAYRWLREQRAVNARVAAQEPDPATPPAASASVDLSPVVALLTTAGKKLKWPKIRLSTGRRDVALSLAGERSQFPGSVSITDGKRFGVEGSTWWGRITTDGRFVPSFACGSDSDIEELLRDLAADPAGVIAYEGRMTGSCCLCERQLDDPRSTAAGYGPTCAKNWGLPWG